MARIVVGVDGSQQADRALRWAVREAGVRSAEIELVHGYVVDVHRAALVTSNREGAEQTLERIVDRNRELLAACKWTTSLAPVLEGSFSGPLIRAGEDADLVVVGSRGRDGFADLVLGSTSFRTAGHAPCPVVIARGDDDVVAGAATAIVVGIDDSTAGRRALRWALDEAALRAIDVVAVHAFFVPGLADVAGEAEAEVERRWAAAQRAAERLVDRVFELVEVPERVAVERQVAPGSPAGAILRHARDGRRLVVVGCRGRGAFSRAMFGSVSHQVLHHANGPVVAVP